MAREPSIRNLLKGARFWQNGGRVVVEDMLPSAHPGMKEWSAKVWPGDCGARDWQKNADVVASAALTEVAHHRDNDLVNADGSPTQKVVRLAPREDCGLIREDGTVQRLYRAVGK